MPLLHLSYLCPQCLPLAAPVRSNPSPVMWKTTAEQRWLPRVPVCSPLLATDKLNAGIAASMDTEANAFNEMDTGILFFCISFLSIFLADLYILHLYCYRVTEMSSPSPRASAHCSLSSGTRCPRLSPHSGLFSSSEWRHLKIRRCFLYFAITLHHDADPQ